MKKKNINSLRLNKESIANLKGVFGGKDQETFEHTCNTVVICAPIFTKSYCHDTLNTICYEEDTIHLEICLE